jgi:hypothetical protein
MNSPIESAQHRVINQNGLASAILAGFCKAYIKGMAVASGVGGHL